ncbi:MAG: glycosyltransferase family 4 protein [Nitrospinae bacterium]|nr:glycosyltransferase family 4 protein [Nitrospinota bacterium]
MKICLTVNSSPWSRFKGGGQIAVHFLASALAGLGHDVTVIYSKSPGENVVPPPVPYRIVWARHFNVATINLNILSFAWELWRLTGKERFDAIHGNAEEAFFFARIASARGAAFFFTSHSPCIPATGFLGGLRRPIHFLKNLNFYLLRAAAGGARRVIVFSRFSKSLVVAGLGNDWEGRVSVVHPGVDPSWFEVKREPASRPDLLFWGRLEEEKGVVEFLRALRYVAAQIPDVRLTLVGEGNAAGKCKRLARELEIADKAVFAGWQDILEIQELAGKSRVGIFPSHVESFGLAVAEAMAAGLPVIATRAGALPEIVDDGVTGTLTPVGDVTALAQAIAAALDNPGECRRMADRGRELMRGKYSWDAAARTVAELYEQALAEI